jgi:hypothetical protein
MNTDTNHLVTSTTLARMTASERAAYTPVPDHLSRRAMNLLGKEQGVYVPRSSKSPLAKWAAEQRRKRRKMQRENRRRNRRG